jgi:hypothetical protein
VADPKRKILPHPPYQKSAKPFQWNTPTLQANSSMVAIAQGAKPRVRSVLPFLPSEHQLGAKLNIPIARRIHNIAETGRSQYRVRNRQRPRPPGIAEVCVIEERERLEAELKLHPFLNREVLEQREIHRLRRKISSCLKKLMLAPRETASVAASTHPRVVVLGGDSPSNRWRTTRAPRPQAFYDRNDQVSLDEVERIMI